MRTPSRNERARVGKIPRTAATVALALCLHVLGCSDGGPQSGTEPGPRPPDSATGYRQQSTLSGDYAGRIDIVGGPWQASGPQQQVNLTFVASGLSDVKQFQLDLKIEPAVAFDTATAVFVTEDPFTDPFPNGVIVVSQDRLQVGAAILGNNVVSGEKTLGTLRITTSSTFGRLVRARIGVERFSVGPTSVERDEYLASELNLGVVVNE